MECRSGEAQPESTARGQRATVGPRTFVGPRERLRAKRYRRWARALEGWCSSSATRALSGLSVQGRAGLDEEPEVAVVAELQLRAEYPGGAPGGAGGRRAAGLLVPRGRELPLPGARK